MSKILIADDERDLCELYREILTAPDRDIDCVASGNAAIQLLSEHAEYELVCADIRMPDGDGLSVLEYVAGLPKKPLVILISGYPDVEPPLAIKLGAYAMLSKPFDTSLVKEVVSKALGWKIRCGARSHERLRVEIPCSLSFLDEKVGSILGLILDVSESGFLFDVLKVEIKKGDVVRFKLRFFWNSWIEISGQAECKWQDSKTGNAGFYFLNLEAQGGIELYHLINDLRIAAASAKPTPELAN